MTTSTLPAAQRASRATPRTRTISPRPRPELPTWFRGATMSLYAVCSGLALLLGGLALTAWMTSMPTEVGAFLARLLGGAQFGVALAVGAWCFAWVLTLFFRDVDTTFVVVHLGLAKLSTALLAGVVRVVHRELTTIPSDTRAVP